MCLKQIPQLNNKDGDSCCFKSRAAQSTDPPERERECWLFNKTDADFSGLYSRIKYNMWGGLIGPIQSSLKQDKEDNLTL